MAASAFIRRTHIRHGEDSDLDENRISCDSERERGEDDRGRRDEICEVR